ncbi:MAG TPA: glutathione S-transferase family protein [Polyangiaceae bacterium]
MSLTLHFHPLASFCWKALIGLYELDVPFEKHLVDLGDADARAAFARLWPLAKFPVLRDDARNRTIPESTIVLEYIDRLTAGPRRLIPSEPERALECRLRDRVYDAYVHLPMQKIVGDRLRPEAKRDPLGVAEARAQIEESYALVDDQVGTGPWSMGSDFTLADCAAMPALFYANEVVPLGGRWKNVAAYLERLKARPSVARVLREAEPYFAMFPRG